MIKRSPQEIADFFGCYVAQDMSDRWYAYQKKPHMERKNTWVTDDGGSICMIGDDLFDIPDNHDWTVLYEPRTTCEKRMENARATHEERTNPEHIREVYTHKEYRIVSAVADTEDLDTKVNSLIAEGWKPQGGVAIMQHDDNHYDTFYQAMVRGV